MTKKENFYYELMKVQNEVSMMQNGRPYNEVNLEEYITTPAFRRKAERFTMKKLEEEMQYWQNMLTKENAKQAVKDWLLTDDGKAYIQERKDKMESIRNANLKILDDARQWVSKQVKLLLGEQWDVTSFYDGLMEISIVEKHLEVDRPVGLFGHGFEVSFRRGWRSDKYEWEMNYATLGSFDLNENNSTRIQYLTGMAKFASDTMVVPTLRDYLHQMAEQLRKMSEQYWQLAKEVKEPKLA